MAGMLKEAGGEIVEEAEEADSLVINTCSFIEAARAEAVETILSGGEWKKSRKGRRMYVTGCLPQRYDTELRKEIPEADGFFGVGDYQGLVNAIIRIKRNPLLKIPRYVFTPRHYRYLRIADGCDRHCAYCAIPGIRGRYHSRGLKELADEAQILAGEGAKELILIAQELNSYGGDLSEGGDLQVLLKRLVKIEGIQWIRLLYLHPPLVEESLVKLIADEEKICPYFDFPIEHISDKILQRMRRRIDRRGIETKLRMIKTIIPQSAIRTSIMSGFPGESEKDFGELVDFVAEGWFDHLGVFTYSPEEGTPAYLFPDKIPPDTAQFRLEAIMDTQSAVSREKLREKVGSIIETMVDGYDEEGALFGRTRHLAPEIDGVIYLDSNAEIGDIVKVKVLSSEDYDLRGEVVDS